MAINVGFIKAIPEKVKQLFAKREAVSGVKQVTPRCIGR